MPFIPFHFEPDEPESRPYRAQALPGVYGGHQSDVPDLVVMGVPSGIASMGLRAVLGDAYIASDPSLHPAFPLFDEEVDGWTGDVADAQPTSHPAEWFERNLSRQDTAGVLCDGCGDVISHDPEVCRIEQAMYLR